MPVTGKSFRRRRADSESEEDEQDSEEVRCVWGGASKGQEERAGLRCSSPARLLVDCEPRLSSLSADNKNEARRAEAAAARPHSSERFPRMRGGSDFNGSKYRVAIWTVVPAAQHLDRGARRNCLLSLSCAKGLLSLCDAFFQIKTGRDPRGAKLEEEAQRGEVGTKGVPEEEGAEMTDTRPRLGRPRLGRPHNYLPTHSPFS